MEVDQENHQGKTFAFEINNREFRGILSNCVFTNRVSNCKFTQAADEIHFESHCDVLTFEKEVSNTKFTSISNIVFLDHVSNTSFEPNISGIKFSKTASDISIHINESVELPEKLTNFKILNHGIDGVNFKNKIIKNLNLSHVTTIQNCNFSGATFEDVLDLSQTRIQSNVSFCELINNKIKNPAIFKLPPNFVSTQFGDLGGTIDADTLIDKANFSEIQHNGEDYAIRTWKVLQNFYSATGNSDGVRKFFELELKEKTKKKTEKFADKLEKYTEIFITHLYGIISGYGYSIFRPFLGLLIIFTFYCSIYDTIIAINKISPIDLSSTYYIGISGSEIVAQKLSSQLSNFEYYANTFTKLLSLVLWFLLGLGVRNKYKIK